MRNPEDRLRKDYDVVENLGDLIAAREERDSAFADDVDALEDVDLDHLEIDASEELSQPHKHEPSEDEKLGLNVELLDTPSEREIEFDWQDSAEEMLATDPDPNEGMGFDSDIEAVSYVSPADVMGPVPSTEVSPETDTASTAEEFEETQLDGGEPEHVHVEPVQIESAMETDSDEEDISIEDRFAGEVDRETALVEMDDLRQAIEKEQQ
jgi:hypothetical protein